MPLDQTILNFFVSHRTEWLNLAMLTITYSGSYLVVTGLTLLSSLSFFIHRHWSKILPLFVSVSGAALTTTILKIVINRGRPPSVDMMYLENQPSFPSGHATAAMALYGFLIYAVYKLDKGFVKNFFIAFLSILIVLVGISRLYLGVHYLSDVIMGYMVGLVWILIAAKLDKKIEKILNWKPGGLNNHR